MMKNILSLLLCAALILTVLSGCGEEPEPTETQPTAAPTQGVEEVELEIPADQRPYVGVELQFLSLLSEEDPRAGVIKQAAEVFELRTGAKVNVLWFWEDEAAMASNFGSGLQIDIFAASLDTLETQLWGYALDLTEMAAASDYEQHSYPVLREQIRERCGYLAAIPQEPQVYGLYYNADAFEDSGVTDFPKSWEEFLTLSQTLVRGGYMPLAMDIENAHIVLELHLERHLGSERFESMLREGGWTLDAAYIDLFQRAIDYADVGYLAKGDPSAFPAGQDKLALSNVAMAAGSNALCGQVERSTMMDVRWGVFPYPGDGEGKGFAVESNVLAVHKNSENPQAAFDFLMLLTTGEFDQLYADVSEGIPADPGNESGIAGASDLLEQADTRGIGLLRSEENELFSRLWNGWYKTAKYFASAMNDLRWKYQPTSGEGVG